MRVRVGVMVLLSGAILGDLLVAQELPTSHPAEKTLQTYVDAFNQGDSEGMAACWSEQGVLTHGATGEEIQGRGALQEEFAALHAENPDRQLEVVLGPSQVISPSVVTQAGRVRLTQQGETQGRTEFDVVYVQSGGKWYIDRVTEVSVTAAMTPREHLEPLAWLVGSWNESRAEMPMTVQCRWTRNQSFLVRSFSTEDQAFSGFQLIGWDPAEQQIRSWAFDSNGGFAEGQWRQESEDLWVVDTQATLPDGARGTATSVFKVLDENRVSWQRTNRMVDGEILPNIDAIVLEKTVVE